MIEPSSLLFSLAEHDQRIWFAYNTGSREIIYLNAAFESFFQVGRDAGVETIMGMVHPDDRAYLQQRFRQMQPGRLEKDIELQVMLPDGKEAAARLNLLASTADNGEHLVSGYLEDITAYKEHSDKLNEFSNKKNAVLNILSHDLSGPLGSIHNYAQILSKKNQISGG